LYYTQTLFSVAKKSYQILYEAATKRDHRWQFFYLQTIRRCGRAKML